MEMHKALRALSIQNKMLWHEMKCSLPYPADTMISSGLNSFRKGSACLVNTGSYCFHALSDRIGRLSILLKLPVSSLPP